MNCMSQPTQKTVNVHLLSSIQHPDIPKETIELHTTGELTIKGGQPYLVYEELQNEKNVRTTVKLNEEAALILRSGGVKMRLPFQIGEHQTGSYDSGFGSMMIMTNTKQLTFSEGQFKVEYELIVQEEVVGTYLIQLTYSEAE